MAEIEDDFNRANEALETGNWTKIHGGQGSISSNQALMESLGASPTHVYYVHNSEPTDADQFAQADYFFSNDSHHAQLIVRQEGSDAGSLSQYFIQIRPGNDDVLVNRLVGTTQTLIASFGSLTIATGDTFFFSAEDVDEDPLLTIKQNGTTVGTYGDSDASKITINGKVGIGAGFQAGCLLDNFSGGAVSALNSSPRRSMIFDGGNPLSTEENTFIS